jgi:hypothetical protein
MHGGLQGVLVMAVWWLRSGWRFRATAHFNVLMFLLLLLLLLLLLPAGGDIRQCRG